MGDEDCLYLDITVPGRVELAHPKAVMVWIHGGTYKIGAKDVYLGAPLASHGDVIVVTINYRLGVLGFLSDGPGRKRYMTFLFVFRLMGADIDLLYIA